MSPSVITDYTFFGVCIAFIVAVVCTLFGVWWLVDRAFAKAMHDDAMAELARKQTECEELRHQNHLLQRDLDEVEKMAPKLILYTRSSRQPAKKQ